MYLRIFDVSQVPINLTHTHRKTKAANSGFFVLRRVAHIFLVRSANGRPPADLTTFDV